MYPRPARGAEQGINRSIRTSNLAWENLKGQQELLHGGASLGNMGYRSGEGWKNTSNTLYFPNVVGEPYRILGSSHLPGAPKQSVVSFDNVAPRPAAYAAPLSELCRADRREPELRALPHALLLGGMPGGALDLRRAQESLQGDRAGAPRHEPRGAVARARSRRAHEWGGAG